MSISKNLAKNLLVILESTVAPGTTREFLAPLLKSDVNTGNIAIELAFSPERIDPLNKKWNLKNTPKIVAGLTDNSRKKAVEFYSKFVDHLIECNSLEIAETAKLLENSFRLINISFINELSKLCFKLGIEISQVIDAASTKPYGFMPFYPSIGVGGHCIPIDPIYLCESAEGLGAPTTLIRMASLINQEIPKYIVQKSKELMNGAIEGKKICIVGLSYKPNISDLRSSPSIALWEELDNEKVNVRYHDDYHPTFKGINSSILGSEEFDLSIVAVKHNTLDETALKTNSRIILDCTGSISGAHNL
jgi:UDP-N-acetyl-D-glucosamine dehydrogenase